MKKAIKLFSVGLLSAAIAASASVSAFAAGLNDAEKKILAELKTTVTMQGVQKSLPVSYVNQAENYFNTVDITDAEATEIIKRIEATKAYLTSTGAPNYNGLTDAQIDTFVAKCQEIVDVIDLTISYDKATRVVSIVDKNGKTVFTATVGKGSSSGNNNGSDSKTDNQTDNKGNTGSKDVINDNPVKRTGFDFNIPGVVSIAGVGILLVSAAGVYLVSTKKKAAVERA